MNQGGPMIKSKMFPSHWQMATGLSTSHHPIDVAHFFQLSLLNIIHFVYYLLSTEWTPGIFRNVCKYVLVVATM